MGLSANVQYYLWTNDAMKENDILKQTQKKKKKTSPTKRRGRIFIFLKSPH